MVLALGHQTNIWTCPKHLILCETIESSLDHFGSGLVSYRIRHFEDL